MRIGRRRRGPSPSIEQWSVADLPGVAHRRAVPIAREEISHQRVETLGRKLASGQSTGDLVVDRIATESGAEGEQTDHDRVGDEFDGMLARGPQADEIARDEAAIPSVAWIDTVEVG